MADQFMFPLIDKAEQSLEEGHLALYIMITKELNMLRTVKNMLEIIRLSNIEEHLLALKMR